MMRIGSEEPMPRLIFRSLKIILPSRCSRDLLCCPHLKNGGAQLTQKANGIEIASAFLAQTAD